MNGWKVKITKFGETQTKLSEPLTLLHDREVNNQEVEGILNSLNTMEQELKNIEDLVVPNHTKMSKL